MVLILSVRGAGYFAVGEFDAEVALAFAAALLKGGEPPPNPLAR